MKYFFPVLLLLCGCSGTMNVYLVNKGVAAVRVWLVKGPRPEYQKFPESLTYWAKDRTPRFGDYQRMRSWLPVRDSGDTLSFVLPPSSTVACPFYIHPEGAPFAQGLVNKNNLTSELCLKRECFASKGFMNITAYQVIL